MALRFLSKRTISTNSRIVHQSITARQLIFSCMLAALLFCIALQPTNAQTSVWVIEQKAQDTGTHTVFIAPDAVKIVCHTMGFNIISKAPTWRIYAYRPLSKELWIGPLEQFNGTILINPFALPCKNIGVVDESGKVTYSGLKCTKYTNKRTRRPIVLAADDIALSAKGCEVLCRYYYTNTLTKVPLYRLIYAGGKNEKAHPDWLDLNMTTDLRKGDRITLSTLSAKKIPYKPEYFEYPRDCRRVKEINQVAYSSEKRDAMGDLIGDLGFTPGERGSGGRKAKRASGP